MIQMKRAPGWGSFFVGIYYRKQKFADRLSATIDVRVRSAGNKYSGASLRHEAISLQFKKMERRFS
jgi:hypothetical protein